MYTSAISFLRDHRSFLEKREVADHLPLGLAMGAAAEPESEQPLLFAAYWQEEVALTGLQTPGWAVILSNHRLPEGKFPLLARQLADKGLDFPGVMAEKQTATTFATAWQEVSGSTCRVGIRQMVYQLDRLRAIPPAAGSFRAAHSDDLDILADWIYHFNREASIAEISPAQALLDAHRRIQDGELYVWEKDGKPVSMAGKARPTRQVIAVNGVFTPPEYRGKGYASNCVARLSQCLLKEGYRYCTLFTDLDFPTSNRIYRRMGYEPVVEFRSIRFSVASGAPAAD